MSRIGKKPIAVPKGVTAKVEGNTISVRGLAKGRYQYNVTVGNYTEDPELEVWR